MYEIKFLDEIDRGDPFITDEEKYQDRQIKCTTNILKKIKLLQPEIYNTYEFYEVLYSKKFDNIELETDPKKFYEQVVQYVLSDFYKEEEQNNDEVISVENNVVIAGVNNEVVISEVNNDVVIDQGLLRRL